MTSRTGTRARLAPYGVYDIAANRGFVSVGTGHDTAAFAVNAIRRWWKQEGSCPLPARRGGCWSPATPAAPTAAAPGLWKAELAALAAETGLEITCCHFPPGTQCRCLTY